MKGWAAVALVGLLAACTPAPGEAEEDASKQMIRDCWARAKATTNDPATVETCKVLEQRHQDKYKRPSGVGATA